MPPAGPHLPRLRDDPYLAPYAGRLRERAARTAAAARRLAGGIDRLPDFAAGHEYFGLHRAADGWVFREWAPNADTVTLAGTFSGWEERDTYRCSRLNDAGHWELRLPAGALRHGDLYHLRLRWPGGGGTRLPAYARRVVQDTQNHIFSAQVWHPPVPYAWRHPARRRAPTPPLVYEAHVGMAQEEGRIGTYAEFRERILPRVVAAGYNVLQLMAVMEHPYYGSFGYHVANFFAASSRFGTPEELKALVDAAHGAGLAVIMDLVHSHAARNETEGLSRFDGTPYQYFHDGQRGDHRAWDSRCFDYGKPEVLHFLLSNCRFWLDEYRFDGFRFDGVTSMLYTDHGFGEPFTSYGRYFDHSVDEDALCYLALANRVIHAVRPGAITVAEDVSGMPGLAAPPAHGGCGFDYRLAMGIPDCWFRLAAQVRDEDWNMAHVWHELTNRRSEERTISYVECHDQAIVGSKTMIFQLCDAEMYTGMRLSDTSPVLDRGIALHKMIRLATLLTAGHGYLTFMGNEFGHPEWIDFPRAGNHWSYHYARRQWRLRDDPGLKYGRLADFDAAMLALVRDPRVLAAPPRRLALDEAGKIMAFERGGWFAFFNFHPSRSLTDYPVEVPPGEYVLHLDTDEKRFAGPGRLHTAQHYFTGPVGDGRVLRHVLRLYLPCRTALVLRAERGLTLGTMSPTRS